MTTPNKLYYCSRCEATGTKEMFGWIRWGNKTEIFIHYCTPMREMGDMGIAYELGDRGKITRKLSIAKRILTRIRR